MVILAAAAAAACGSSAVPKTVVLAPGHYHYRLGHELNVGDSVKCHTASGRNAGGGTVPKAGNGVSSSTGFELSVGSDSTIAITCPAHVGVM